VFLKDYRIRSVLLRFTLILTRKRLRPTDRGPAYPASSPPHSPLDEKW